MIQIFQHAALFHVTHPTSLLQLPRYTPNYGWESGVYLQFITDFYHNLPDLIIFVHAHAYEHNAEWPTWARCLKPTATYASLSYKFIENRNMHVWLGQVCVINGIIACVRKFREFLCDLGYTWEVGGVVWAHWTSNNLT